MAPPSYRPRRPPSRSYHWERQRPRRAAAAAVAAAAATAAAAAAATRPVSLGGGPHARGRHRHPQWRRGEAHRAEGWAAGSAACRRREPSRVWRVGVTAQRGYGESRGWMCKQRLPVASDETHCMMWRCRLSRRVMAGYTFRSPAAAARRRRPWPLGAGLHSAWRRLGSYLSPGRSSWLRGVFARRFSHCRIFPRLLGQVGSLTSSLPCLGSAGWGRARRDGSSLLGVGGLRRGSLVAR